MTERTLNTLGFQDEAIGGTLDRGQLSYLIHDMRSVTTSVSLMVDLLELAAKAEDDSIQRARAVSAQKSCEQLALLCAEVAMLLSGADDPDQAPRKFNLLELLVEANAVYSPIYDLAGKELRMNATGRSPQFFGVRTKMFRAISNLLDNGLKHTIAGATVDISCVDTPEQFVLSISDNGPGMEELKPMRSRDIESLPIVVRHRANPSIVFAPGTGLRFVAETVLVNGGKATVVLNERGGCTFALTFKKQDGG